LNEEQLLVDALKNPKTREKAFRELVATYQKPLYYHIRGLVLDHDDASDVLQNTWIKIYRNIDNFRGDSKLYSWFYRIASNESFTFLQSKSKKMQKSVDALIIERVEGLEADTYFDGDALQIKLQKAIVALPQKQQIVFKMRYFDALSYEQISEILETSVGALKASYHHASKKIEEFIKNH
jgi:RNA polymerase sigma-70 factor, ECF subfamily